MEKGTKGTTTLDKGKKGEQNRRDQKKEER